MGTRQRILAAISDPNIAYILFLVGLAGLYFELAHPGVILPGIIGGISLILAFFALTDLAGKLCRGSSHPFWCYSFYCRNKGYQPRVINGGWDYFSDIGVTVAL